MAYLTREILFQNRCRLRQELNNPVLADVKRLHTATADKQQLQRTEASSVEPAEASVSGPAACAPEHLVVPMSPDD